MSSISNDTSDLSDDDDYISTSEDDEKDCEEEDCEEDNDEDDDEEDDDEDDDEKVNEEDEQSTSSADSSEEIDVEGIDDTWSEGSSHPTKKSGKSKKVHQNDLERKRREEISQSYHAMKEVFGIKTCSRSQLLLLCSQKIIEKEQSLRQLNLEIERLKQLGKGRVRGREEGESSDSELDGRPHIKSARR